MIDSYRSLHVLPTYMPQVSIEAALASLFDHGVRSSPNKLITGPVRQHCLTKISLAYSIHSFPFQSIRLISTMRSNKRPLIATKAFSDQPASASHGSALPPIDEKALALKFRAGVPSLYLVETLGEWTRRQYERIYDANRWQAWIGLAGLPVPQRLASSAELVVMRALRRAIYHIAQAVRTGRRPSSEDIDTVNLHARRLGPALLLTHTATTTEPARPYTHADVLGTIARDAIALFSGPLRTRIRECASPVCPVLFVDQSPRGDRRWCSVACGSVRATARYRRRLKGDDNPPNDDVFCIAQH